MSRSKRLLVVLQLAQRKEEEALKAMQVAQSNVNAQKQQLQELVQYQQEYQQALRNAYQGGATATSFATYQHFLSQVGGAIEQQQQMVLLAEQQYNQARTHWQTLHEKQRGMGDLIERFRDEELREKDRKEQQMIDELSQRKRR